jgi:hypothetical protein
MSRFASCDGRRRHQPSRLAHAAPAHHQVEVFVEQAPHHAHDVVRAVLQVAVEGGDDAAARRVDAGLHGRGLAEVAPQDESADMVRTARHRVADARAGRVAAAVVDQDQLPRPRCAGEGGLHLRGQRQHIVFLVAQGHHHGQDMAGVGSGHGRHGRLSSGYGRVIPAGSRILACADGATTMQVKRARLRRRKRTRRLPARIEPRSAGFRPLP